MTICVTTRTGKLALANAGKFLAESPSLKLPTLADGAASPVAGGAYGVISFISMYTVQQLSTSVRATGNLDCNLTEFFLLMLPGTGNYTAYPPVTQAECNPGQGQQK